MLRTGRILLLLATTLSAQVRLRYLDFGPQPQNGPCCMTTDAEGNAYVAASYVTSVTPSVTNKIVVYKINPANGTVYRLIFGGSGNDTPTGIAADATGNLFVVGMTTSGDFPTVNPLAGSGPLAHNGEYRGFLSKIDPTGKLVFSTFIGGTQSGSQAGGITLDAAGDVYLTGTTSSTDFSVTPGAYEDAGNAFVMKVSNTGDRIMLSTFIGSNGAGVAIAVDSAGVITVAGTAFGDGFPPTPGAFQTVCGCGTYHIGNPITGEGGTITGSFVLRLSADGSRLLWSTYLGGSGYVPGQSPLNVVQAIVLTSDGEVVVAGISQSSDFPVTPGAFQVTNREAGGGQALFVTRLNSAGTALKYSTFLGGSISEQFGGLQLDSEEHAWLTGMTQSPDFPLVPHSLNLGNGFVAEFSADGSKLLSTRTYPYGAAGAAFAIGASGEQTLLGSVGSLIRIPEGSLTKISLLAQLNAAAYVPSQRVAPGEQITLIGTGLGPVHGLSAQPDSTGNYPTKLADVQVTFDGIPAPLLFVSTHQINAVVPFEVRGKTSILLRVKSANKSTTPLKLLVVPAYPEIFSMSAGTPAALFEHNAAAINEDGSVNSPSNPARLGSTITFWVDGAGQFTPGLTDGMVVKASTAVPELPVSVAYDVGFPDAQTLAATFKAAPGQVAGVLEVAAKLPDDVPGSYPQLTVQVGDFVSDTVTIVIQ